MRLASYNVTDRRNQCTAVCSKRNGLQPVTWGCHSFSVCSYAAFTVFDNSKHVKFWWEWWRVITGSLKNYWMGRVESLCEHCLQSRAGFGCLERRGVIENTNASLRKGGPKGGFLKWEACIFQGRSRDWDCRNCTIQFSQHSNTAAAEWQMPVKLCGNNTWMPTITSGTTLKNMKRSSKKEAILIWYVVSWMSVLL